MGEIGTGVRIFAAIALAIVLAVVAQRIYEAGGDAREAAWLKREAQINAEAATKLKAAEDRYRAAEQLAADRLASISGAYQNGLQENSRATNADLAALRAGRRLYIPATCPPPDGSGAPQAAAGAGGRDGEARAELSEQAAEWLVGLASEADAIVLQLSACQAVIRADRAMLEADAP